MVRQKRDHRTGRLGERIAHKIFGGKKTNHKAPFDIVDFQNGIAYEVKAMHGCGKDMKIHIAISSMEKKMEFIEEYGIREAYIIAVVIYSPDHIEVYRSELKPSLRINQMVRIN